MQPCAACAEPACNFQDLQGGRPPIRCHPWTTSREAKQPSSQNSSLALLPLLAASITGCPLRPALDTTHVAIDDLC